LTLPSFINRVSKVKRWQQRAAKLLATARSREGGAPAAGKEKEGGGQGEGGGAGLRESIEALLAEVEVELKVSGVPEAVELSRLLEEASAWEDEVRRAATGAGACSTSMEDLMALAQRGERVVSPPQLTEALRWRAACLQAAAAAATQPEAAGGVTALLAAGDNLSAWSKSGDTTGQEKKGMSTASGGATAAAASSGGGRELVAQIVAAGVRSLGWHSWRVLAARAAFPTPLGSNPSPSAKPTLADGHALLDAVISPGNGSGGSGAKPVAVLEGAALATAAASAEFAALREAVAAKDAAATMAWKWRDAPTSGSGGGGWGRAFPAPPSTTWKEAVAVATGGGQRRHVVAEWETWRKSASGLVEGMEGVLAGVVDAAPSLRSALESQLQARIEAGRWLVASGGVLFPTGGRLPTLDSTETLVQTPPPPSSSATAPYKPGDDALPVGDDPAADGASATAAANQRQSAAVFADVLAGLQELRGEASSWLREARGLLAGAGGGGGAGGGAAVAMTDGSAKAVQALLARDVVRAMQFPEEKLLREALEAHGQWDPKVLAILTVPVVTAGGGVDSGGWLAPARALLARAPPTLPPGSSHLALLRWTIAVGETAQVMLAATTGGAMSFNESRPAFTDMEPLAERGRTLLLGGTGVATLLSAVGIAPPAGVVPLLATAPPAPLSLRLGDGPLTALSTVEAVTRGVDACRQWVAGATALVSPGGRGGGGGLDGASSARLVQELQANRQLPYAIDGAGYGGGLRATLAHELSLKAPEHPELAHHLGSSVGSFGGVANGIVDDEDDAEGMAGAIDMNDVGWASSSDLDSAMAAIDVVGATTTTEAPPPAPAPAPAVYPPAREQHRHSAATTAGSSGGGGGGAAARNGGTISARAAGLQTASVARAVPPPLFTNSAAPTTRGSRNQRTSPFNLKACSACKKGRISAIKCRVDCGPDGERPGSPHNARTAAAAAAVRNTALAAKAAAAAAAAGAGSGPGSRSPAAESASSLLDRLLGTAALPPPPPAPVVRAPVPAPRAAPGAPAIGGAGLKRTRCLTAGCDKPVGRDVAFCSDDCVVSAQRQAVQALVAHHRKQQQAASRRSSSSKAAAAAAAANGGGGGGGGAAAAGANGEEGVSAGGVGGEAVATATDGESSSGGCTAKDEQAFAKGLEAVRARSAQTAGQRFRHKVMDRFRELFAEGMAELGVDRADAAVLCGMLAWDLEHELNAFSRTNRGVYKEKAQSLRFNIKFAKNPELFKDLLSGGTSMKTLCGMSTDELASSHLKEERKRIRDESYAGHLRQEDEGNEIVYKDGALQKIDKVKAEAAKQMLEGGSKSKGGSKTGSSSSGGGGSNTGGSGSKKPRRVKAEDGGGGGGKTKQEVADSSDDSGDDDAKDGGGGGGGVKRSELLKRRLSASSDLDGGEGGGEGSAAKRMKRLLAVGSPIIGDVPKLEFPSAPLPEFPSSPLDKIPSPPGPGDDSDDPDDGGLRTTDVGRGIGGGDGVESDGDEGSGNTAKRKRGKHRRGSSGDGGGGGGSGLPRLSSPPASPNADMDNGLSEPRFSATNEDDDDDNDDDDDDMEIEEDEEEEEAKEVKPSRHSAPPPGGGGGGGRPVTPPPEVEGMTRVAPKPGKAGRAAKSENFVINEPGREPFYVHAFHGGGPEHCVDLQANEGARLPRNLDVDGRVSMTNLNGTMKSRAAGSIRVLVLRPGGGGPNNPNVLNRFCQEFAAYKNQGRAGYCFKQFDKKHVEFLYLVPPALAPQVPLLAQNPAAHGHLVCLVITVASAVVPPPAPVMLAPQPPPQQQPPQTQYLYRPPPPTFTPSAPAQQQPTPTQQQPTPPPPPPPQQVQQQAAPPPAAAQLETPPGPPPRAPAAAPPAAPPAAAAAPLGGGGLVPP
ncbi:unnamed protein product, partial [Ectocarpus sp. 12 AP-2014]